MAINGTNSVDIIDINNAYSFLFALEFSILPTMNPFPGPKSVLVVDNAAVHNRVKMYILNFIVFDFSLFYFVSLNFI